jgi:LacI family transcriptional regulator
MVLLEDIAKQAGVSISTVSRALQNDPRLSEATIQKVSVIADSLGYTKHKWKKEEKLNLDTVGLIVPEVLSGYYAQLVHIANEYFGRHRLSTITKITDFRQEAMIRNIKNFSKLNIKCLLIVVDDSEKVSKSILRAVSSAKVPTMFITSKYMSSLDFDSLYIDEHRGIVMAIEHLVWNGYKNIGYIGEEQTLGRYHVYKQVMQKLNMPINESFVKISQKRAEEGGYKCMSEMLKNGNYPDAVFVGYDQMAIGAIFAIEEANLSIPEDIAIVGFDDILVSKYIHKGITTIKNPYHEMIAIAVRVLLQRTEFPDTAPQQIALKPSLIIRGTT